jgi:Uma2 family endonuclease
MAVMTSREDVVALRGDVIIRGGPFTIEERDRIPDNGMRHELLDGVLVMTPAPSARHQDIVFQLAKLLDGVAPASAKVFLAPFDVRLGDATVLQPDLVVARREDVTEANLPAAPLLAVEVLSPSTALLDLNRKKTILEEAGCPAYWVIDPSGPTLTAWELVDGAYAQVAVVGTGNAWTAVVPFAVTIRPADLLDQ